MSEFFDILADTFERGICVSLVLSRKRKESSEAVAKVSVRPVTVKGRDCYQLTSRTDGHERHENLEPEETRYRIKQLFEESFQDCHLFTTEADYSVRTKADGTVHIRRQPPSKQSPLSDHDRVKRYLIPENTPCPFLIEIGVMTPAGKVRAAKYQKFRQINRFLELVDDIVDALPKEGRLNVVDFGCGKSYLTFALHYLLQEIHGRDAKLLGLDRNPEVIDECTRVANRLGCRDLEFCVGDIANHQPDSHVDLAVSLHACDTATDDAIAKAVAWQADVILAVPCCQHELASKIHHAGMQSIDQHGILKERFAAIATDALRAAALEISGYKTQVVEFIDMEHTAKNVLIRARRRKPDRSDRNESIDEYRKLKEILGLQQIYLEGALGDEFVALLHP